MPRRQEAPLRRALQLSSGNLYIDTFISNVPPYGQIAGDEPAGLPYAHTIK